MARCPHCDTSSKAGPEAIWIERQLAAKPLRSRSLSGALLKTVAVEVLAMVCRCGWQVQGWIDGEHFIADPFTEIYPIDGAPDDAKSR